MTHDEIMALAKIYARRRGELAERVRIAREEQRAVMRRKLRGIRSASADASAALEALEEAIDANRGLFERPRTQSVEGVKYGLRKKPGRLVVDSQEAAIARLRKRLGAAAEAHVRTREELVKDGLRELDARTLAHIGVSVVEDTDVVTVAAPKDDLDKLVDALLDGVEEEA